MDVVPSLAAPSWVLSQDSEGRVITFVGQSGPVVTRDLVVAIGSVVLPGNVRRYSLYGIGRRTGLIRWEAPIASPALDSWSSPTIDERNSAAVIASGRFVSAFDLEDGSPRWQVQLARSIVNASPLVITDLAPRSRICATDADGFGSEARLYCINADPRCGAANPHDPGEVLWSVPLGSASGATPAYADGVVFVGTAGDFGFAPGRILAFDARAANVPAPLWEFENVIAEGFFGSPAVVRRHGRAALYAASYAFFGGLNSANLVKLDARTGALMWSIPSNRTAAAPLPLPDGRIIVSGGIQGYGTVPSLECFTDEGESASLLWHSALDTWTDADRDGALDVGEFLLIGGWTHTPGAAITPDGPMLLTGAAPTGSTAYVPCTDLYAIDPRGSPGAPGFILDHAEGLGSTPALAGMSVYTIGEGGLFAFGPLPPECDVNGDGIVTLDDLHDFEQGRGEPDVNRDGTIDGADRTVLVHELRGDESRLLGGRR